MTAVPRFTAAVPRFTAAERRARLGVRHRLAAEARAERVEDVAAGVVGLHSTDAAAVFLAAWARLADRDCGPEELQRALYDDRSLVRLLAMRRTMFVVERGTAPVVHAGAARAVAARERAKLMKSLEGAGRRGAVGAAWLAEVEDAAVAALREAGELTATELAATDPRLAEEVVIGSGRWTQPVKLASRVLLVLGAEARVVRARPRGGWASTQFRWAAMDAWLGAPLEAVDPVEAERALARAWLARFGPARAEDLKWWAGWTVAQTKRALAGDDVVACALADEDDAPAFVLADDVDPVAPPEEWIAFLPALDATPMGWKHRDFYLGPHADRLFDVNGNVAPTVWHDGRIVGGWTKHPTTGEITYTLLEDLAPSGRALLAAEASALSPRLADATLAPRGRGYAPLERELLA